MKVLKKFEINQPGQILSRIEQCWQLRYFSKLSENFKNLSQETNSSNNKSSKQPEIPLLNVLQKIHISHLFALSNLISHQLSELQSQPVINLLQNFNSIQRKFENNPCDKINTQISYNQTEHLFTLNYLFQLHKSLPLLQTLEEVKNSSELKIESNQNKNENESTQSNRLSVEIKIRNCQQQKLDHPSVRETLYFHELKDLDKHIKYEFLPKTPLFIQDMNRKKLQMKVLDQRNPYGFPLKAPTLIFDVQISNKLYIRIKSTYEETQVSPDIFNQNESNKSNQKTSTSNERKAFNLFGQLNQSKKLTISQTQNEVKKMSTLFSALQKKTQSNQNHQNNKVQDKSTQNDPKNNQFPTSSPSLQPKKNGQSQQIKCQIQKRNGFPELKIQNPERSKISFGRKSNTKKPYEQIKFEVFERYDKMKQQNISKQEEFQKSSLHGQLQKSVQQQPLIKLSGLDLKKKEPSKDTDFNQLIQQQKVRKSQIQLINTQQTAFFKRKLNLKDDLYTDNYPKYLKPKQN